MKRIKVEGQLNKLAQLVRSGHGRDQARRILGVSDRSLDELLRILQERAEQAKEARKRPANRSSARTLDAKRRCQKCGREYTRRQGGTKILCGDCYERYGGRKSTSVKAILSAFESNRQKH